MQIEHAKNKWKAEDTADKYQMRLSRWMKDNDNLLNVDLNRAKKAAATRDDTQHISSTWTTQGKAKK